ncbi:hypothetical protein GCM10017767_09010 [Halomonas urumqiensis]|nr:hypothetical protein GCM10017767_09010 [Halomonas urumqiensis]
MLPADLTYVLVTMNNRKVYIGSIKHIPHPNEERTSSEEFLLVPHMSGFRDEEGMRLEITHYYEYESVNNIREEDSISLPKSDIVTIGPFTIGSHKKVLSQHGGSLKRPTKIEGFIKVMPQEAAMTKLERIYSRVK